MLTVKRFYVNNPNVFDYLSEIADRGVIYQKTHIDYLRLIVLLRLTNNRYHLFKIIKWLVITH